MTASSPGVAWGNWLVSKASGVLDAKLSRRSFIARTTLLGSAVAATGFAACTQPGSPYQQVTNCPSGTLCTDGYTEFCCVINQGVNACPPNTLPAGWWRADGSQYCGGGARYYIDCNQVCCGPGVGGNFCAGCSPCRCAGSCDTRRVYCNYFRYGQCNQGVQYVGPIACRMVSCTPPYQLNIGCDPSGAVDDATANHNANCAAYAPPPPPAVLPSSASAVALAGNPALVGRGVDGAAYVDAFNGSAWSGWAGLGGAISSRVAVAAVGSSLFAFTKGPGNAVWFQEYANGSGSGWSSIGGAVSSDPVVVIDSFGYLWVFARGPGDAVWTRTLTPDGWLDWYSIGGVISSDPAAAADASGNIYVTARGSDGQRVFVQSWSWSRGTWGGWYSIGGAVSSDFSVLASGSGSVWVFARGPGDGIWVQTATNGSFGGWQGLGGAVSSDPAAVLDASGEPWVFVQGPGNAVWAQSHSGGSWSGWQDIGGSISADPDAVAAGNSLWVFAVGPGSAMWTTEFAGGSWSQWQDLGGAFAPVRGYS